MVEEWRVEHRGGRITMYWVRKISYLLDWSCVYFSLELLTQSQFLKATSADISKSSSLPQHVLCDTATHPGVLFRESLSSGSFVPFGHVLLRPESNDEPDRPEKIIYSIHSLFISSAMKFSGFGSATLHAIEKLATKPPHNSTEIQLYTIDRKSNMTEGRYASRGREVPKVGKYTVFPLILLVNADVDR